MRAVAALVLHVACQQRAGELHGGIVNPVWPIALCLKRVAHDVAYVFFVVAKHPLDVGSVGDVGVHRVGVGIGCAVGCRLIVGDCLVLERACSRIIAAGKFIPWVVGQTIAVDVDAHHHNAGFAGVVVGIHCIFSGVAIHLEIAFAAHVHHRMVEAEHHISAKSAKRHHAFAVDTLTNQLLRRFLQHCCFSVAFVPLGHKVDVLPGSRAIIVDFCYVLAVLGTDAKSSASSHSQE